MELFLWLLAILLCITWFGIVAFGPPYVPTLKRDVKKLFEHLKLNERDHVVDLGSGDGRVLVACASRGVYASGVELNPFLVWISRYRLRKFGDLAKVELGDIWRYNLPEDASVVFVFFAKSFMNKLDLYLEKQKSEGRQFRLVSYGFLLPNRTPSEVVGAFNIYDF